MKPNLEEAVARDAMGDLREAVADALDDAVHEYLYADCGDGVSWRDGGQSMWTKRLAS